MTLSETLLIFLLWVAPMWSMLDQVFHYWRHRGL